MAELPASISVPRGALKGAAVHNPDPEYIRKTAHEVSHNRRGKALEQAVTFAAVRPALTDDDVVKAAEKFRAFLQPFGQDEKEP